MLAQRQRVNTCLDGQNSPQRKIYRFIRRNIIRFHHATIVENNGERTFWNLPAVNFYKIQLCKFGVIQPVLDGKLNTQPLLMIVGLFIGLIVAGFGVYRMIRPLMNDGQDKENG